MYGQDIERAVEFSIEERERITKKEEEYRQQYIPRTREVCNRDPEEVQDDGLQVHNHTYGIKLEAIE